MKHLHLLPLQNFRATVCIALLDNIISELEPSFHSLIQRSLILLFLVLRIMVNDEVYDDDVPLTFTFCTKNYIFEDESEKVLAKSTAQIY